MPRRCSVCASAQTAVITKDLLAGVSLQDVADRFNVTKASVGRHLRGCLRTSRRAEQPRLGEAQIKAPGSSRFDTLDPPTLVAATARLVDEALDLLEHAKRADDRRTALVALREARDGLALLMKAAGMLAGDAGTTIIDKRTQNLTYINSLPEDELRALIRPPAIENENGTAIRDAKALNPS
jgi:hypothetical protein